MLKQIYRLVLSTLRHVLSGTVADETVKPDAEQWKAFFHVCCSHSILALAADALPPERIAQWTAPPAERLLAAYADRARAEILSQANRTGELCLLYRYLRSKGLHPLVMKGIVCRALYPDPEHRPSTDEDLLVKPAEFQQLHQALLNYGFVLSDPGKDAATQFEVAYQDKDKRLYIEVHKTPFTPDSPYLDRLNDCFLGAHDRAVTQQICGTEFLTLGPEDHLLYLLLHALKHFLYSGFGIRQICDIGLYAEAYRTEIDWDSLRARLENIGAMDFARAVFRIAEEQLLPESRAAKYLADWDLTGVDPEPLLADVMEGGIYGSATMSRLHSSNMTLRAASTQSGHGPSAVLYSLFPPLESMQGKYPCLKKIPVLLPAAWLHRQLGYLWELIRHRGRSNSALTSIRVGNERIRLLEQYNIIKS